MAINNLGIPAQGKSLPRIAIIGVGGGGCNAVHRMGQSDLLGVELIAANTDVQDLSCTKVASQIHLGSSLTNGFGAGTDPDIGRRAAEESEARIRAVLDGVSLVFLTAGMGGGTGTGALPVIGRIARELNVLTIGVVTKPFHFEGEMRMDSAMQGLNQAGQQVDTLLVIANQNLFPDKDRPPPLMKAFRYVDDVLLNAVRGVVDLIMRAGLVNMDFADLVMALKNGGMGVIGSGEASGPERGQMAAQRAAENPLLDGINLEGAGKLLINVTGGDDLDLTDMDAASAYLRRLARDDVKMKIGAAHDPSLNDRIRVYIVASGIHLPDASMAQQPQPLDYSKREQRVLRRPVQANAAAPERKPAWGNNGILNQNLKKTPDSPAPKPAPVRERIVETDPACRAGQHFPQARQPEPDQNLWSDDLSIDTGSIAAAPPAPVNVRAPLAQTQQHHPSNNLRAPAAREAGANGTGPLMGAPSPSQPPRPVPGIVPGEKSSQKDEPIRGERSATRLGRGLITRMLTIG